MKLKMKPRALWKMVRDFPFLTAIQPKMSPVWLEITAKYPYRSDFQVNRYFYVNENCEVWVVKKKGEKNMYQEVARIKADTETQLGRAIFYTGVVPCGYSIEYVILKCTHRDSNIHITILKPPKKGDYNTFILDALKKQ